MPAVRALLTFAADFAAALVALLCALWRAVIRPRGVEWVAYEIDGRIDRGAALPAPLRFGLVLPRGPRVSDLARLRRELAHLRTVPSLRGVYVRIGSPECGLPLLRELRAELESLRDAGLRVVASADAMGLREYWLASAADEIWLAPRGRLELTGFAAVAHAAAAPLRRLGVEARVIRAGTFKAAGELLGADRVSDENRRQLDELVGDLADLFVADVARSRRCTPEDVRSAMDAGPYTARAAHKAGLVDALAYADEARERLGRDGPGRARLGPFAAACAAHPPAASFRPFFDARPLVAVLDVEGVIAQGRSRALPWGPVVAGSDSLVAALERLRRDRRVRSVVLRVDSRGGSALASDLIWRAVRRLRAKKPVVAFLDSVAASGGYYIAAGASRIVASPACVTGSIGVIAMRPDVSSALARAGVDTAVVRRGARAAMHRPDVPLSPSEEEALRREVREIYGEFVAVVAEGRGLPVEQVQAMAEGRVYLAPRALRLHLVDALGTTDDAANEARRLAGVEGEVRMRHLGAPRPGLRAVLRELRRSGLTGALPALAPPDGGVRAWWAGPLPEPADQKM